MPKAKKPHGDKGDRGDKRIENWKLKMENCCSPESGELSEGLRGMLERGFKGPKVFKAPKLPKFPIAPKALKKKVANC